MGLVLGTTSVDTARELIAPLVVGGSIALAFGEVALSRVGRVPYDASPVHQRPFSLTAALVFAATVTVITFVAAGCERLFGAGGVALSAAVGGFADAHAAAASVATLVAQGELKPRDAVIPVLLALSTNIVTKAAAARITGRHEYTKQVWAGLALVLAGIWIAALPALW